MQNDVLYNKIKDGAIIFEVEVETPEGEESSVATLKSCSMTPVKFMKGWMQPVPSFCHIHNKDDETDYYLTGYYSGAKFDRSQCFASFDGIAFGGSAETNTWEIVDG